MKNVFCFALAILLVLSLVSVSAEAGTGCNLDATLINQDPDPVSPGDYVEVVFQLSDTSNSDCNGAKFEIIEAYPFSLDSSAENQKEISGNTFVQNFQSSWNIPYRIRVDKDALEGENTLDVKYAPGDASSDFVISKRFDITIEDARVDFEVSVKDYNPSTNEITFEILNIGESDIEALTVEIPEQENIKLKGTPRNVVGSLDSNEETTFDFKAVPSRGEITLDIFYTDTINERRFIEKTTFFNPDYFGDNGQSSGMSIWFWLFIALILLLVIKWGWKKRKARKHNRR